MTAEPRHTPDPKHDPYAALRHRDFRLLWLGSFAGTLGEQMVGVAMGWELYERTHWPAALGYVGLVLFLPVLLLSLPAGHTADRYSRKGQLLAALGLLGLSSLGLAALSSGQGPILLVYGCLADLNVLAIGLAAASLLAVMVRLTLTFRQNVSMLPVSPSLRGLAPRATVRLRPPGLLALYAEFTAAWSGMMKMLPKPANCWLTGATYTSPIRMFLSSSLTSS